MTGESEEKEQQYTMYGLSPPKTKSRAESIEKALITIKRYHKDRWEHGNDEIKKILVFLYGRGAYRYMNLKHRCKYVNEMLAKGKVRKRMLQVISAEGDSDISSSKENQEHYISTCLTLHRYFRQNGAKGFVEDMSKVVYYLRQQTFGSCFLQAPCIAMCYMLQTFDTIIPPADGSRLIRHNFTDDQLYQYIVKDAGGDSTAILKILDELFFDCDYKTRPSDTIYTTNITSNHDDLAFILRRLEKGPGLMSKFCVPSTFHLDKKVNNKGPGVARFTEWGKAATFISLDGPTDNALFEKEEEMLKQKWRELCLSHNLASTDNLTVGTASMSLEEMSSMESCMDSDGDSESGGTIARSNNSTEESSDKSSDKSSEDSSEVSSEVSSEDSSEDSSKEFRDGFIEIFSNEWDDSSTIREGSHETYHAMVLLGTNQEVDGPLYWVLQNSWASMQIIEMSTEYLAKCGAELTFLSKTSRHVKESSQRSTECCSAPMAESSILERMDCENWDDSLISSGVQDGARNEE